MDPLRLSFITTPWAVITLDALVNVDGIGTRANLDACLMVTCLVPLSQSKKPLKTRQTLSNRTNNTQSHHANLQNRPLF